MKLHRVDVEQTGVLIAEDASQNTKTIPLYSNVPIEEAEGIIRCTGYKFIRTYYSNNLLSYKIEDLIRDFISKNGFLPENYMDELVSGFPYILGMNENYCFCYR